MRQKLTVTFCNYFAKAPVNGEMKATERQLSKLNLLYSMGIMNDSSLETCTCFSIYTITDL
jgi:hypothetical protein